MATASAAASRPDESPDDLGLLGPALGALEAPIRSAIFGAARFEQHGRSLARTHAVVPGTGGRAFFPRLADNAAMLQRSRVLLEQRAAQGRHLGPAAHWLLDNAALIDEQMLAIRAGLPRRFFRMLPLLRDEPLAGLPRVYSVAWAWVAHTDSGFDPALLAAYLRAYQEEQPLTLAELWALHTTLRVVLVENLRRLAERTATQQAARDAAHAWLDAAEADPELDTLRRLAAKVDARGVSEPFALTLMQRQDELAAAPAHALADWLHARLPEAGAALSRQQNEAAEDQQSIRNAIGTLRELQRVDWRAFIAGCSAVMTILDRAPVHAAETEATQDATLHQVERLARRSGHSEAMVAQLLFDLASQTGAEDDPRAAPAYWWRGAGENEMRARLGLARRRWPRRGSSAFRRLVTPAYLVTVAALTFGAVAWLLGRHTDPGAPTALLVLTAVLLLGPVSEAVVAVLNRLISESLRPVTLPRLAFAAGVPATQRTLVVIPALLGRPGAAVTHAAQLEQHYLANPEPHAQFALLSDFTDADSATTDADAAVLAAARREIDTLNERHPVPDATRPRRFLLLHRPRRWSETEQRWLGWERKRGKLEQLVGALVEPQNRPFVDLGPISRPAPGTHYIVTLDADTGLPPGRLRALVGVAAHPLNQPQLDPVRRRVLSGYAILQPRVVTPLPAPEHATGYHSLFSGHCGIDAYSAATSEIYQDLFGEGSFTGKGLLNVQALHATLAGRLPDGQVLSHDLLEGSVARCAGVSDITVEEDAPMHGDVAASRLHRWTRGDWQLLPFLFGAAHLPLAAIHRWKLLDNLRRSLVAPASCALMLVAAASGVMPFGWAALVVAAAFAAGPLLGAVAALAPSRDDIALRPFYRQALADLARVLLAALWQIAQLLELAMMYLDAIGRACWRQAVSRRHLLQWTTAAAAQAAARTGLRALLRQHRRTPLAAAVLLAGLLALQAGGAVVQWWVVLPLLALWSASGVWTWLASRTRSHPRRERLADADRAYLQELARDTWRYYERHVTAEDQHLPPDNVQHSPYEMVAHRTSPTNIGLYLLAVACARELGLIGTAELAERVAATLDTLEKLPRHRGHLFNWYDTRTLAVLAPAYVSTVDSGNCSGHLLVVAQACDALADAHGALADLARRARALALAPDYGLLYDRQRRLLHIGLRVDIQQLDHGHYDLLASEARLTSLVAIAKGDVPVEHWAALGRPFFAEGTQTGLRSWSGSMFEYLMASLVLDEPVGSVLHQATRSAVVEQRGEARGRGTPWGISESAIAAQDHTLAYQYGPQGVARLALRRTPTDERVIAPYASALALLVAPHEALANLRALQDLGARGALGFIEAIDYTPQRQATGAGAVLVDTTMAHHQAMSLVAICDVLCDGAPRRWSRSDPHLRAVHPLLHERAPREVPVLRDPPVMARPRRPRATPLVLDTRPLQEALPATQWLSNGRYAVMLRSQGSGWSQWHGLGLNRWRDDLLLDTHGHFFYVQRHGEPARHSLTAHPAPDPRAIYRCRMQPDRVIFEAHWPDLESRCTVWVSPEDDGELRRVELTNTGDLALDLTISAAAEVTLAPPRADEAHPAFSNLFVQARWDASERALYLHRTPRLPDEQGVHAVHCLARADDEVLQAEVCTDRLRWWGRYGSAAQPIGAGGAVPLPPDAVDDAGAARPPLPGIGMDTGLDPMAVISARVHLEPGASTTLTFLVAAAAEPGVLDALVDKYRQASHVERASSMSHTMASIQLRELQFDAETWAAMLTLNTLLSALTTRDRPSDLFVLPGASACDRRALWRHGIGGDRPIVSVDLRSDEGLGLVQTLARALPMWTAAGVGVDLVVVNGEPTSYQSPVHHQLMVLLDRQRAQQDEHVPAERRATLRLLREPELSAPERATLHALARVRLRADGRSLADHVSRWLEEHRRDQEERRRSAVQPVQATRSAAQRGSAAPPPGRFDTADGAFRFDVSASSHPARPWINVLANPGFGCHVSEVGAGHTWAGNSRMHQITRWSNDAVADPAAEWLLLQDRESGRVWPLGRALVDAAPREVEHGIGSTRMRQRLDGLDVTLTWCVDAEAAVKQIQVSVQSTGTAPRALRVVALAEWLLGSGADDRLTLATSRAQLAVASPDGAPATPASRAPTAPALLCTQLEHAAGYGQATAVLALRPAGGEPPRADAGDDWTCDRREFHDASGRLVLPARLGRRSGTGLDACAALGCSLTLPPRGRTELTVLMGHAATPAAAQALMTAAWQVDPEQRLQRQRAVWDTLTGSVRVHTPDPLFDALANHWLPYQTVVCRLWARAGFYQAGGAFGFRDQLQDAMALVTRAPQLLAAQIRTSAARQFPEGDVQHWWHEPGGAGVRTHFSDDRLWLPYALAHYVQRTGDRALLDEAVPFLVGAVVPPGAEDIYETPAIGDERVSLYEHAARAVDCSLKVGAHGLPLIGTGDWNDGMNRVGHQGRGESVWLAWFLCQVVDDLLPIAETRGDAARTHAWQQAREGWVTALDAAGWDGRWYRRGYFDDGSPLGSAMNRECRIDLIAQAWAVLAGAGRPERAHEAFASAQQLLWDDSTRLMRLLDPPLQHAVPGAGYIQAYPPGVRENGGQYNHGAAWALMAAARLNEPDWAWRLFTALSPAHRSADAVQGPAYGAEPYVMAGDVCSHAPWAGRCGWSWYTGSSGWMLRAAIESLCGVVCARGTVTVQPCLPPGWDEIGVQVRHGGTWWPFVICANAAALAIAQARFARVRLVGVGEPVALDQAEPGLVHVVNAERRPAVATVHAAALSDAGSEG